MVLYRTLSQGSSKNHSRVQYGTYKGSMWYHSGSKWNPHKGFHIEPLQRVLYGTLKGAIGVTDLRTPKGAI